MQRIDNSPNFVKPERRSKPRLYDPIPVMVQGSEGNGELYKFDTVAQNIGPGGLSAFAPREMREGEELAVRIRFSLAGTKPIQAPVVAARAIVVRVEKLYDNACTFAVSFFTRQRKKAASVSISD